MLFRSLLAFSCAFLLATSARASHDAEASGLHHHALRLVLETDRAIALLEAEPAFGPGHAPFEETLRFQALDHMRRFRIRALSFEALAAGYGGDGRARYEGAFEDGDDDIAHSDDGYGDTLDHGFGHGSAYRRASPIGHSIGLEASIRGLWRQADLVEGPLYSITTPRSRHVWDHEVCRRLRTIARLARYR